RPRYGVRRDARCTMRRLAALWMVSIGLLGTAPALAQSTFGTLVGTVTDATGGVLPGVNVAVVNPNTGVERVLVSDGAGSYQAATLAAGREVVSFAGAAFPARKREVELLARETVRPDARLQLAGNEETVDVRAASPVIQTERATIDSSRSGDDINKLALN